MMNRRKNLFLFYELNEDEKTYHSNLVRLYTNPLIIDEDHQIEILGICHLENWTNFYCNISIVSNLLQNSRDYITQNSDIHFIYGSSYYYQRITVNDIKFFRKPHETIQAIDFKGNSAECDEYEELMQATIEDAIENANLNDLCLNISLTMLSGHLHKPVNQATMEDRIIIFEITTNKLFPEQIMRTHIDDDVYEFQQRILLSNSYKAPEIEPELEMIIPISLRNPPLRSPESSWCYERLTSMIFRMMSLTEQNLVKLEHLEQKRRYDDFMRKVSRKFDLLTGMDSSGIDHDEFILPAPEDQEMFHEIRCYRFTSSLTLNPTKK